MLTPYDDLPIHQTADPITQPASGDPNHYDRFYFGGHSADGDVVFAAAMGLYPNRNVIDASFSVVVDGTQHSVFASGRMPRDRATTVGPLTVEYIEPLRTVRLRVDDNDSGITADLTFTARTAAVEEPRQRIVRNATLFMDYTRMTQWGRWQGTISAGGRTLDVRPETVFGTRDRSWGIRTAGPQVPNNLPFEMPQLFWLWAPIHFDDHCTHLAAFEHADGTRWMEQAVLVPVLPSDDAPTWGPDIPQPEEVCDVTHELHWKPGTREIESAALTFTDRNGPQRMEFEPVTTFFMRGIGYAHPTFGHGHPHGELEVFHETIRADELKRDEYNNVHVQTVCRVRKGDEVGVGVLEQFAIGEHTPSGLTGLFDGWQA